ncbi:MAG TPA: indolepyruvate oxidoreductase subunit beta [Bacillota bacterium]
MKDRLDIIISGVGGQGTILASRVLAQAALNAGFTAGTAETIGMAQREGSVQSHVRIGSPAFGPLIGRHGADVLLGFEPAEAQRACPLMKPDGIGLVNLHPIHPVTVALDSTAYPLEEIKSYLCALPVRMTFINAFQLANVAGNFRTVNAVMLGALAGTGILPVPKLELLKVLLELVPERARDVNERAFELGFEACKDQ